MRFAAPAWLWLLAVVYALGVAYLVVSLWGRRRYAVRFTNLALLGVVAPRRPGWRRHVPAVLLLLSLASSSVAMARPHRMTDVPVERASVVMALDVSLSMMADDVEPTRIDAARAAAHVFVDTVPDDVNLGLVAFAGTAQILVPPTGDRVAVRRAIDGLRLAEATAIGDAIMASLAALEMAPGGTGTAEPPPGHIVLMSDGETNTGTPNDVAAARAAEAGVGVSTIAFGTDHGVIEYAGQVFDVPVNEEALELIAATTGGLHFRAVTAEQLADIYAQLGSALGQEEELREITTLFVGLAVLFGLAAAAGSLVWFARLP